MTTYNLAFSATQDAQSKPNMTFSWDVSQQQNGALNVKVSYGRDATTSDSVSVTIPFKDQQSYPVIDETKGKNSGGVSVNGAVHVRWGANGAWVVIFDNENNTLGAMERDGFVNVYQCVPVSGVSRAYSGIIVAANIPDSP